MILDEERKRQRSTSETLDPPTSSLLSSPFSSPLSSPLSSFLFLNMNSYGWHLKALEGDIKGHHGHCSGTTR